VPDATNYYFQLATDPNFTSVVFEGWLGNFIGIDLNGFPDNGQPYYWRVAAGNASEVSFFSSTSFFVNGPSAPPATPLLNSPANGITVNGTTITFRWNQSARATNYYLQVAADAGFSSVIFEQWMGNFVGISLSGFPDNGQRYHWRVAAGNALGSSFFSSPWTLLNGPSSTPATPALSSPANGTQVNGTVIAFRWNPSARASNYYLQVATDAGFSSVIFEQWVGNFLGIDLTGFPDDGQRYHWRVAAGNALGSSFFSGAWSLLNGPSSAPATPVLNSPANGAQVNGTVIAFRWNAAARANNYYLEVGTDAAFTSIIFGQWVGNFLGIDLTGFPDNGQRYYWRVASGNALGSSIFSGAWSVVNGPSGLPATPTLSLPADGSNVAGAAVPFRWNAAAGASDYFLQVATDSGFTSVIFGQWVGNFLGIDLTGFPDDGQGYYWRVAAGNALGSSAFSGAWTFVNGPSGLPETSTLNAPANGGNVGGVTIPFRWNLAPRANNYRLTVALDAGFTTVVFDQWIGNYIGIDLTGFPDDGQQYYWRVAAGNALGASNYSIAWSVVNGPSATPDAVTLTALADGAFVPGATVQLRWNPAARANNYRVEVAVNSSFTGVVFDQWIGNFIGIDLTGFADNGQQYYWRVTGGNALGSGPASTARSFVNGLSLSCTPALGTGAGLLLSRPHIDSCFDNGAAMYFLRDASRRANQNPHGHNGLMASNAAIDTHIEGVGMAQDADNVWNAATQAAAVDGHVHAGLVYDYQLSRLGLNGFNNAGPTMLSIVESSNPNGCPNNAFWDGTRVTYCVGSGMLSFVAALDVAAHEWAHAVTERASALPYNKETGALNEAFSDWMGNATEHANGENNWTIGEGVLVIRDMANPNAFQQPDTYGGTYWINTTACTPSNANDYCGVHTNSGVPNKMFYLLSVGGAHNGVQVQGLGIDTAMRVGMEANRRDWSAISTFVDARAGMVQAAKRLFGEYSIEQTQVRRAWAAVGVGSVPPVANAGTAQTVASGSAVTLTGSATDQDGTIVSYAWTQIAGPTVALTNANTATAGFTAPTVSANTVLTFRLVVTDNVGEVGSGTVNITVVPPQAP